MRFCFRVPTRTIRTFARTVTSTWSFAFSPNVAVLSGKRLQENAPHQAAHKHWQSFRRRALKVMNNRYGDAVTSGRKTIKLAKGELHADADLVVTLSYKEGVALYLPDERRWVVSFPQAAP